jgi:hypothetical protein
MRLVPLGRTGLFVSELCLGTMTFGGSEGMWSKIGTLQQQDAERLVGQALDARHWTRASISSTPPTCMPAACPSRSPARRCAT